MDPHFYVCPTTKIINGTRVIYYWAKNDEKRRQSTGKKSGKNKKRKERKGRIEFG